MAKWAIYFSIEPLFDFILLESMTTF